MMVLPAPTPTTVPEIILLVLLSVIRLKTVFGTILIGIGVRFVPKIAMGRPAATVVIWISMR